MRKIISFFTALVLLLSCFTIIQPIAVKAEGKSTLPFTIAVENLVANNVVDIKFSSDEKVQLYIHEENTTKKESIYSSVVENSVSIEGILLNQKYSIDVETVSKELYTGYFILYNKAESEVIGLILDINKVERNINFEDDTDYTRRIQDTVTSVVYEREKNDNLNTANKLFEEVIYGKISASNDVDYFKTMFYEKGDVVFLLDNIPDGKDFDLYVYDSNKKQIASSCSTNNFETITIKDVKLNDWYYIKVAGYNKSFDNDNYYRLTVSHIPKKIVNYGHTFETARILTTQNDVEGEILFDGDSNYFKFTPAEDAYYVIYTTGTTDTYGYLYNKDRYLIASNDDKPDDPYGNFEIKEKLKSKEQYFIQVKHYSIGTRRFTLKVEKESNKEETYNNIDNPIVVEMNTEYPGIIPTEDSQNWFSFTPEATGSYSITSKGSADTYGILYDDTKTNIMMENSDGLNTKAFELANTLLEGKTYYIKVTAENFDLQNNQYNLFIEKLNNPDDENFQEQWGLLNYLNGVDINILPAWQYSKGNGFKIGIADTGTDDNHIDLKKNIDLTLAYNFIHNMKDVFPANENLSASSARAGHGTHVAGIIGAEANNGQGIAGIAPESTPIPLKVLGSRIPEYPVYNGAIASFVNSIQYAKDNDIRIMNCSFGGYAPAVSEQEAMLKAEEILFVIAAGNDGNDLSINPEYPACYYHDNSIVVAAVNANGELAIFSNYGGPTDIAAPGEKILSTYPQNNYTYKNGTSMAAPVVSAVAGLVWSDDLGLTPIEIKERLTADSNVTKLDSLKNKVLSDGVVNAFKAIVSNKTETSARSIKGIDRNIFGRDIKAKIKYYKDNTKNHEKTDKIIVKFADGVELVDFINNINQKNIFKKMKQVEHLELINAYVFEFSTVEEADKAVDVFNAYGEVVYAEPNYLRSQN
ncbi:S8 family peptidase [Clostridium formicaceticum]|uniref:Thermitase n=1 Tax=Clostridium formicaceticum TaxID=1497 RepID=A0AAC9RMR7_9CLOT|nr:S8 family peptidase [Clostridium formicaceticum]AOY74544.1 hypothetical protein BJL90_00390 [Clostridium formicaceticum]ARE88901.1 Thermitase [Clostridium formicaceticum]